MAFDVLWRTCAIYFLSKSQAPSVIREEGRARRRIIWAWPFFSSEFGLTSLEHCIPMHRCKMRAIELHPYLLWRLNEVVVRCMELCPGALGQQTLLSFRTKDLHPDVWECARICSAPGWPLIQKGIEEIRRLLLGHSNATGWLCGWGSNLSMLMHGGVGETWEEESCGLQLSSPCH